MKKITTIIFAGALAIPSIGLAQVNVSTTPEGRNAVVEEWTGIYCGYCPIGHATVSAQIASNPGRVSAINIHSGSFAAPSPGDPDFRTAEGDALDAAFGISGYPSSTLNRRTITFTEQGQSAPTTAQEYHPAYLGDSEFIPTVLSETSEVNMHAEATLDVSTNELSVEVEYYYTANAPNPTNYLNVAILQNNVEGPQSGGSSYNPSSVLPNGNYNHMHIFRQFMTGQWGEAISTTTTGSTAIMSYNLTLPADYTGVAVDIANIEIVAYINNGVQSAGDVLTGITVIPTLTGFSGTDEVVFTSATSDDVETCDATLSQAVTPKATIQNWGSNVMTTATITYDINGGTAATYNWTGSLNPGASEEVTLDPIAFVPTAGANTINVSIANPNGVADNTADNAGSGAFNVLGATETQVDITVNFFTDAYPEESSWEILSSAGTVVANGGPYASNTNTTMTSTHTLPSAGDCYSVRLYDSYGDGQGYGTGQNPNGGFGIQIMDGTVEVFNWDAGNGWSQADRAGAIKTPGFVGLDEIEAEQISVFPNPASSVLNIKTNLEVYSIVIMDLQGKEVVSKIGSQNVAFSVVDMASGSYFAVITTANGVYSKKVIIK